MCLCYISILADVDLEKSRNVKLSSKFAAIDSYGIDSRCMVMLKLVNLQTIRSNSLT